MADYRDAVIEALADSEAALLERLVESTIDRDAWRLVAMEAIHQLSELTQQLEMIDQRRYVYRQRTREQLQEDAAA